MDIFELKYEETIEFAQKLANYIRDKFISELMESSQVFPFTEDEQAKLSELMLKMNKRQFKVLEDNLKKLRVTLQELTLLFRSILVKVKVFLEEINL